MTTLIEQLINSHNTSLSIWKACQLESSELDQARLERLINGVGEIVFDYWKIKTLHFQIVIKADRELYTAISDASIVLYLPQINYTRKLDNDTDLIDIDSKIMTIISTLISI